MLYKKLNNKEDIMKYWIFIITSIVGIVMISIGVAKSIEFNNRTKNYLSTDGRISYVEEREFYNNDSHMTSKGYKAVYEYNVGGTTYTIEDKIYRQMKMKKGKKVKIKYNKTQPKQAYADEMTDWNLVLIVLGAMSMVIALIIYVNTFTNIDKRVKDLIGAMAIGSLLISFSWVFIDNGLVSGFGKLALYFFGLVGLFAIIIGPINFIKSRRKKYKIKDKYKYEESIF